MQVDGDLVSRFIILNVVALCSLCSLLPQWLTAPAEFTATLKVKNLRISYPIVERNLFVGVTWGFPEIARPSRVTMLAACI